MSRRSRHGRHANAHAPGPRPAYHAAVPERPATPANGSTPKGVETGAAAVTLSPGAGPAHGQAIATPAIAAPAIATTADVAVAAPAIVDAEAQPAPDAASVPAAPVSQAAPAPGQVPANGEWGPARTTCTTAQLRRFIKSRPWVPLHELRRRFGISGDDDDVSPIRVGDHLLFVGLPAAEARMVGELLSGGDVGYELSLDPTTPIVVGVYPMRPVPRG